MVQLLFEDIFGIEAKDPDGKKFDKVSRIVAQSEKFDMYMQLDVNTEIYPIEIGEKYTLALAPTLNLDGTPDTGYYTPGHCFNEISLPCKCKGVDKGAKKTLADKYEYVMHGKLYRISDEGTAPKVKVEIYISFGGLLMMLKGDPSNFTKFELDQRLFLLMRKVEGAKSSYMH